MINENKQVKDITILHGTIIKTNKVIRYKAIHTYYIYMEFEK